MIKNEDNKYYNDNYDYTMDKDYKIMVSGTDIIVLAEKLAYSYCKRMYSRSGLDLYRQLMHGGNLAYSIEDMIQDIALAIVDRCPLLDPNYSIYLYSWDCYTDIMRVVNSRVYQLRRNSSHKSLYIDIDGEEVCITDVMGMCRALDDDTRWYALMLYDSMVNALDDNAIDTRSIVDKSKLTIYGYQRIVEGRAIKDCDYNYCDQWLKRHRDLFDI